VLQRLRRLAGCHSGRAGGRCGGDLALHLVTRLTPAVGARNVHLLVHEKRSVGRDDAVAGAQRDYFVDQLAARPQQAKALEQEPHATRGPEPGQIARSAVVVNKAQVPEGEALPATVDGALEDNGGGTAAGVA